MPELDWIVLSNLRFPCILGVYDWEQRQAQMLDVEIGMGLSLEAAAGGNLSASVNYAAILEQIQFIALTGKWRLLESMASAMVRHVLAEPVPSESRARVEQVRVKLTKPGFFLGRATPSIEIVRSRNWARPRPLDLGETPGLEVDILQETEEVGAYHFRWRPGAVWALPGGAALHLVAGSLRGCDPVDGAKPSVVYERGQCVEGPRTLTAVGQEAPKAIVIARPALQGQRNAERDSTGGKRSETG